MVEEGIRGGNCHTIQRYAKANNKYMKDYDKKNSLHTFGIKTQIIYMAKQ